MLNRFEEIYDRKLKSINSKLEVWDYETLYGKGFYRTTNRYAHLEIKIYKSLQKGISILWNITEEQIPESYNCKLPIEKMLMYFTEHLYKVKKEEINLVFEINDGSYHIIDTDSRSFILATLNSIIHCFDTEIDPFDEIVVNNMKSIIK